MRTKNKLIHEGIFVNLQSMNFLKNLFKTESMLLLDPVDMPFCFYFQMIPKSSAIVCAIYIAAIDIRYMYIFLNNKFIIELCT